MSTNFESLSRKWKSVDCIVRKLQQAELMMAAKYTHSGRAGYANDGEIVTPELNPTYPQYQESGYYGTTGNQTFGTPNDYIGRGDQTDYEMKELRPHQEEDLRTHVQKMEDQLKLFSSEFHQAMQDFHGNLETFYGVNDHNMQALHEQQTYMCNLSDANAKSLQSYQEQMQAVHGDLKEVKEHLLNFSSSQHDSGSILSKINPFGSGSTAAKKADMVTKKQHQESLKTKDEEIQKLRTTLHRCRSELEASNSLNKCLEDKLRKSKQYATKKEQEANAAEKQKQAMILEARSWQEGHHQTGKKKKSDISRDFAMLFSNNSRPIVKYFKELKRLHNIPDVELKHILSRIFEVAYSNCKLHILSSMFDELFKPRPEASKSQQHERAMEQAQIYGFLSKRVTVCISPDVILESILDEVKMRIPKLIPLIDMSGCSKPNELITFIRHATTIACDMVSTQPPMFIECPPVTKEDFNPAIHEESNCWDENADDGDRLVYYRPILYPTFETQYDDPEEKARLAHIPVVDVKQRRHAGKHSKSVTVPVRKSNPQRQVGPSKLTYIDGDDAEQEGSHGELADSNEDIL